MKKYLIISLKGIMMGAADIVPGVSGGTVALITGIYEELINSLKSIDHNAIKLIFKKNISLFWKQINGNFLVSLFIGIIISIVSLAKVIGYLLDNFPVLIWAFFFGLILASAIYIGKTVKKWNANSVIGFIIGTIIALWITLSHPGKTPNDLWFIFLTGMIAICAMILPGISGSFVLLLMGKYQILLDSISNFKISIIITFGIGCFFGLISFSHLLSWMFKKYHDLAISILTGFMIGALNHVWPWKKILQYRINSHGKEVPFIQESVSPFNYDSESFILGSILLFIVGIGVVFILNRMESKKKFNT